MQTKFNVAIVQTVSRIGEIDKNIKKMTCFVEDVCKNEDKVKLIVFPELVATGFVLGEQAHSLAELSHGRIFQSLAELAKRQKIYLVYGYIEQGEKPNVIYDSLAFIDDRGKLCANYRKIHLTEFERDTFTAGSKITIAQTELGKFGLMICWDLAFPEQARLQTLSGCNVLLSICAWEKPYGHALRQFAIARSIDNSAYNIVVNAIGTSGDLELTGQSSVYDLAGQAIASLNEEEAYSVASIDFKKQQEQRESFYSMLEERRTDIYQVTSKSIETTKT